MMTCRVTSSIRAGSNDRRRTVVGWRSVMWVCLALLCLSLLGACSMVRDTAPAPISSAVIIPAVPIVDAEVELVPPPSPPEPTITLPTPMLEPWHKPVRRPVRRPPAPARETPATEAPAPAPAPAPAAAPLVSVEWVPRAQARGLLDAEVQRQNGKVIGRAVDLVADAAGKLRDIVINLVGFMGVGDRKVSLPWNAIRFDPAASKIPITLKSDSIEPVSAQSARGINLLDASVRSRSGAEVGRVIDVLIDAAGQPRAVVLDVSGALIHDEHMIAADWSAFRVVGKEGALRVDTELTERQVEASPPYETGKAAPVVSPAAGAPTAASGPASTPASTSSSTLASASSAASSVPTSSQASAAARTAK